MTRPWDGRSNIEGADLAGPALRAEIVEAHDERKLDAPPVIHSIRLPGLVAHQEMILGGPGQYLTIRHDTTSRETFVPGVLLSLEKLHALPPGLTVGLGALLED